MLGNINDQDTHNIEMKDSGISWLGEIPAKWSVQYLKHLASISTGNRDTIEKDPNGAFPFFVRSEKVERISSYSYDGEAVLIPGDGNVGSIFHHYIGKYDCHQRVYNITNFTNVSGRFIYYYMSACFKYEVDKGTAKSTVDSLRLPMLMNYPVCFGSLDEQKKIVSILDYKCRVVDNIIRHQSQTLENLRELKQSIITEVVTKGLDDSVSMRDSSVSWIGNIPNNWEIVKLKTVCKINPNPEKDVFKLNTVGYVPMECLGSGVVTPRSISIDSMPTGLNYFEDNDILMAKVTPCFENGDIAIVNNLENGVGFGSSELFVFRTCELRRKYLYYLLQSESFKQECASTMAGVAGLKRVSAQFVRSMFIPDPPISEMNMIAEYLDEKCLLINNQIKMIQNIIKDLIQYKQSLIYEFVTGKRTVNCGDL